MSFWVLIRRSLRFHARTHIGVVLGAAISAAAIIGALIVGDSVRTTLRTQALGRLQGVAYALSSGDRFFTQALGSPWVMPGSTSGRCVALQLAGTAVRQDAAARANQVNVFGIEPARWKTLLVSNSQAWNSDSGPDAPDFFSAAGLSTEERQKWQAGETVMINEALARRLSVKRGDEIILRIARPSQLVQDAVISPREGTSLALRVKVGAVLPQALLGDFSLRASPSPVENAFLPLKFLANKVDLKGRANLFLNEDFYVGHPETALERTWSRFLQWVHPGKPNATFFGTTQPSRAPSKEGLARLDSELRNYFQLEDAQLSVRVIAPGQSSNGAQPGSSWIELKSSRIFLESNVVSAALRPRT
ncbi:MAG TPA: hypothetical protein VKY92_22080, partial [Verrucomicrobiae bacterium]|nr:hypothetical protein [Verrucomicrobiae bacterium]